MEQAVIREQNGKKRIQNNNATAPLNNSEENQQIYTIVTRGITEKDVKVKTVGLPFGENRAVTTEKKIIGTAKTDRDIHKWFKEDRRKEMYKPKTIINPTKCTEN